MGAWGAGSFENDDALDWLANHAQAKDLASLEATFDELERSSFGEAPDCAVALAAAEIVAAVGGRPADHLPEDAKTLARVFDRVPSVLVAKARVAVVRIARDSELRHLWQDSHDFASWDAAVRDLERRLLDRT